MKSKNITEKILAERLRYYSQKKKQRAEIDKLNSEIIAEVDKLITMIQLNVTITPCNLTFNVYCETGRHKEK